jgi:hypothetical protein
LQAVQLPKLCGPVKAGTVDHDDKPDIPVRLTHPALAL